MFIEKNTTISKKCDDNLTVKANSELIINGMCSKTVLAEPNSKIIVKGICHKLEISENSSAEIFGTVNHLVNHGNVVIAGTVKKLDDISNTSIIEPGAFVNNKKY